MGCEGEQEKQREAPPGKGASSRFKIPALWLKCLIQAGTDTSTAPVFPLRSVVRFPAAPRPCDSGTVIEYDASLWGGGSILKVNNVIIRYFFVKWANEDFARKGVLIGQCKWQTFWEFLTLLIAAITWSKHLSDEGVLMAGDNTASLQLAMDRKGKKQCNCIARELVWRHARRQWRFDCAHLPAEQNLVADALSRQHTPKPSPVPS